MKPNVIIEQNNRLVFGFLGFFLQNLHYLYVEKHAWYINMNIFVQKLYKTYSSSIIILLVVYYYL